MKLKTLLLLAIIGNIFCREFNVGGKSIHIPAAEGFEIVTPEMTAVNKLSLKNADVDNELFAYYIEESNVEMALAGEIPPLLRTIAVKANYGLQKHSISVKAFKEFKETVKTQNEIILDSIKAKIPELSDKISSELSDAFNEDMDISVSNMIPLPFHYEDENTISFSMYLSYGIENSSILESTKVVGTVTYVNVAGKVLFLYVYAPQNELEWSRKTSQKWVKEIIATNSTPPKKKSGINWMKALFSGLVWGGIAFIFGLISSIKKKKDDENFS